MSNPLISCIVPAFNSERFLGEALDSILTQAYQPLELIVVDDGSSDGTADVAARYGRRIRYVRQENRGPASARNLGLELAQGELIAFLDADDVWHPDKLTRQYRRLVERPELSLCFTRFQNFWVPELAGEAERYRDAPLAAPLAAWSIGTLLTPRETFERFGMFQEELKGNENMIWFLQAATKGAIVEVLPDVLMQRRIHGQNDSLKRAADLRDVFVPIVKAWRDYKALNGER